MSKSKNDILWKPADKAKSIKEIIVDKLIDAILDNRLPIDSLLPPEPDMCSRLGVSRVAFREAVKQLEILGFLKIKRGNGTLVTSPDFKCLEPIIEYLGKSSDITLKDLHQVRSLVEVEIVRQVARAPSKKLIKKLVEAIADAEKNINKVSSHIDLDYEFHRLVIEASPNKLLSLILGPFSEQLRKSRILSFKDVKSGKHTLTTHKAILAAIELKDPEKAAAIMTEHLQKTAEDLGVN